MANNTNFCVQVCEHESFISHRRFFLLLFLIFVAVFALNKKIWNWVYFGIFLLHCSEKMNSFSIYLPSINSWNLKFINIPYMFYYYFFVQHFVDGCCWYCCCCLLFIYLFIFFFVNISCILQQNLKNAKKLFHFHL